MQRIGGDKMKNYDKLIFELSQPGRKGYNLPELDVEEAALEDLIPAEFLSEEELDLPEVSEVDVMRHYTNLSNKNYGLDTGFYPLGSCTMKYNPKINEDMASLDGFVRGIESISKYLIFYTSNILNISFFGRTPTAEAEIFPSLTTISVGILIILNFAANSASSSTLIFPTLALPDTSFAISSTVGDTILQGPHQDAQKSNKTGSLEFNTSFSKLCFVIFIAAM